MQRHMALIRMILEYAEQKQDTTFTAPPVFDGFNCQQLYYHVGLCGEAGYLTVRKVSGAGEAYARFNVGQLTWEGHEAIEQMRK